MNFHSSIVHFPIVLLIVGVVCDAIGILNHRAFFLKVGYLLFALGTFAAIPAALTGDNAADLAQHIAGITPDLDDHDTLGSITALLAIAITLARTHFIFKKQFVGTIRYLYLVLALTTAGLVCASGYTGGHLVYHYGAGTTPVIKTLKIDPKQPKRIPRIDTFESK